MSEKIKYLIEKIDDIKCKDYIIKKCSDGKFCDYVNMKEYDAFLWKIHNKGNFYALKIDKDFVGYCVVYMNDTISKIAYITAISVDWSYQGFGVGSRLIKHIISEAKNNLFKYIKLEVNNDNIKAIEFYKKCGFNVHEKASNTSYYYYLKL